MVALETQYYFFTILPLRHICSIYRLLYLMLLSTIKDQTVPNINCCTDEFSRRTLTRYKRMSYKECCNFRFNMVGLTLPRKHLQLSGHLSIEFLFARDHGKCSYWDINNHSGFSSYSVSVSRGSTITVNLIQQLVPVKCLWDYFHGPTATSVMGTDKRSLIFNGSAIDHYKLHQSNCLLWTPTNQEQVVKGNYSVEWYYPETTNASICYQAPEVHNLALLGMLTNTPIPDHLVDRYGSKLNDYLV